jgi:hypothetical protein
VLDVTGIGQGVLRPCLVVECVCVGRPVDCGHSSVWSPVAVEVVTDNASVLLAEDARFWHAVAVDSF